MSGVGLELLDVAFGRRVGGLTVAKAGGPSHAPSMTKGALGFWGQPTEFPGTEQAAT